MRKEEKLMDVCKCKSKNVHIVENVPGTMFWCKCFDCNLEGLIQKTPAQAVEMWNRLVAFKG